MRGHPMNALHRLEQGGIRFELTAEGHAGHKLLIWRKERASG
jgi:hypothetical protein